VDWATVTSVAITGAVGIAGVAGTIIAARIAGNAATQSARLTIGAEDRRAWLADKRRVYGHSIAALDASVAATTTERGSRPRRPGQRTPGHRTNDIAANTALLAATDAMGELQLVAPPRIADLADRAAKDLAAFRRDGLDDDHIAETRQSLFYALRADLDEEAGRGA